MKTQSLCGTALVVFVQMFSPAIAQGLDQMYEQEQSRSRSRHQVCLNQFASAQYVYVNSSSGKSESERRFHIDSNTNAVRLIHSRTTNRGVEQCGYDTFKYEIFGRNAEVRRALTQNPIYYLIKQEGYQLVLYEKYRFGGVKRRVVGVKLW